MFKPSIGTDDIRIFIELSVEQYEFVKSKNKQLAEILDKNRISEDELEGLNSLRHYYTTLTSQDYDSFIEVINLIISKNKEEIK